MKKQQLQKDIKQLKQLIFQTQNQRVGSFLAEKLVLLKTQLQLIVENQVKLVQKVSVINQPKLQQAITLTKFSWQDIEDTKKVKSILIHLQNIKKLCKPEQIQTQFLAQSLKIKINNYKDKNYVFGIRKLYSEIVPQKCSFSLSQNYLTLKLEKKHLAEWIDIHFRKDIFKQSKQQQKQKNHQVMGQQQKLMDMVKKIYKEGDPQMQKAIKQAFDSAADKRKK